MKTVIFDFDGTIADSFKLILEVFEEVTKRNDKLSDAEIDVLRSKKASDLLKELGIKRWRVPGLLMRGRRKMKQKIGTIRPFTGLDKELRQLESDGYRMLILSTNSSANIEIFLKNHNLSQYFEKIYGSVGIFNKSAALKKLLKREKIKLSDAIYIGDELRDIEAAKKLGIDHITVGWGFNTPQALSREDPMLLISKPTQLKSSIDKIART